ncbi:MAG: hypothetical protein M1828_005732 [Chrysothrix sp. TS-e1954]|nr:MAG: hypothetical protein M1828_005732 [Chrysothrix sp. TS-e1954]
MPSTHATTSNTLTFLLLISIILFLFPAVLQVLIRLPILLLYRLIPHQPSIPLASTSPTSGLELPYCVPQPPTMSWFQKTFTLPRQSRGSYLVTDHVTQQLPELKDYKVGILHLFVQHTSCALALNENWDEEVREDMSDALDRIAPEDRKGNLYRHAAEGADDMPAHIKSALIGASVTIPISNGRLNTGTWQGIWYLEFRKVKHERRVVATIQGEKS